jgi:hypothetical protein
MSCLHVNVVSRVSSYLPTTPHPLCHINGMKYQSIDHKMENSFALKCGHRLCTPCWKGFLETQVNVGTAAGMTLLS